MQMKGRAWFRAFGEGAVIVGSILLAFTLDAWWDDRNREQELRAQRGAVLEELRSVQGALNAVRGAHALNVQLLESMRQALAGVAAGEAVDIPDQDLGPLLPQVTADITTGSLEAFIAAGGLDIIDDANLRRDLLVWSTRMEDLLDDEIYLRNFAAADLAAYLRTSADVANAEIWSTPMVLSRFGLVEPPDSSELGSVTLRRDRTLMNLLAARESGERAVKANLDGLLEQAGRMILLLETAH